MVLAYLTLGTAAGFAAFLAALLLGAGLVAALAVFSSTATVATLFSMVRSARCLESRSA